MNNTITLTLKDERLELTQEIDGKMYGKAVSRSDFESVEHDGFIMSMIRRAMTRKDIQSEQVQ